MKKRTKKAYADLYDNPAAIAEGSAQVILFPNGQKEIFIRTADDRQGFRLTVGQGPAGLSITLSPFTFSPPLSVTGNLANADATPSYSGDFRDLEVCQYFPDPWSQAFKAHYCNGAPHPGARPEYDVRICPIDHAHYDYEVTVIRRRDRKRQTELVSGGMPIVDAVAARLQREFGATTKEVKP